MRFKVYFMSWGDMKSGITRTNGELIISMRTNSKDNREKHELKRALIKAIKRAIQDFYINEDMDIFTNEQIEDERDIEEMLKGR